MMTGLHYPAERSFGATLSGHSSGGGKKKTEKILKSTLLICFKKSYFFKES